MTPSIPDNFVTLAAAVEIAAEDWFPGDFLRTEVDPAEWQEANKIEIYTQSSNQSGAPEGTTNRSRLHSIEISTPNAARVQGLQEKLNDRRQLLLTVWRRFRQLLHWGELPSKVLTDSGRIEAIPASLWLGKLRNSAYAGLSSDDRVDRIHVSVGDKSLEGYIIIETVELWRVISARQLCRAAFQPAKNSQAGALPAEGDGTEPKAQIVPQDSSAAQDAPPPTSSEADTSPVAIGKKRLGRGRAQRIRAEKALSERFPNGIPGTADIGNKALVLEVRKHLPKDERISDQTILRAAGRKR
jgi:hypothetical protein